MGWEIKNKFLEKEFKFADFTEAINFINQILPLAEEADHHPDILIYSYNCVKIMLYTHSEQKVTAKDYELAKKIDLIKK